MKEHFFNTKLFLSLLPIVTSLFTSQLLFMKKLSLFLSVALFAASCFSVTSCKEDDPLSQSDSERVLSAKYQKTPDGGLTKEGYAKFIQDKLKSSKVLGYTEHGPFTTPPSSNVEIPGTSGSGNFWKQQLADIPGYVSFGIYFCRYYEHSYTITLPPGEYVVPGSMATTGGNGFQAAIPPNPVYTTTQRDISTVYYQGTNQTKITTYTLVPKYYTNGQSVNPNNISIPVNYTNPTFTYKTYTL